MVIMNSDKLMDSINPGHRDTGGSPVLLGRSSSGATLGEPLSDSRVSDISSEQHRKLTCVSLLT